MSASNPALSIDRISVVGEEAEYAKMFDPPTAVPATPELVAPTNPVPEVMQALGLGTPAVPHTRHPRLLNGFTLATWDGLNALNFFGVSDVDFAPGSLYPGPTFRQPRGVVFHGLTVIGGPPHTIHWHGIEPTPMNDGVGHCSMEIGGYSYQWQPNFIGTYFYHCHRNTVQHFEFGLFGLLPIEPPDAYFASVVGADFRAQTLPAAPLTLDPNIPVGACSDGKRRTAANTAAFPQFEGFVPGDPVFGVAGPGDVGVGDPHAFTVPYDVECLWVPDDRDSVWSNHAPDRFTTFPAKGTNPGVDDVFNGHVGVGGFFAFNHYDPDYWFVTGVPVRAARGGTADLPVNSLIPPNVNSGIGARPIPGIPASQPSRVDVAARVGQTILVRCLDAAYQKIRVTFPVDVVLIAWDGRALGVPPFAKYNQPVLVPAGTPIVSSVARRFDLLIKPTVPINDFATIEFLDGYRLDQRTMTARIPFVITA